MLSPDCVACRCLATGPPAGGRVCDFDPDPVFPDLLGDGYSLLRFDPYGRRAPFIASRARGTFGCTRRRSLFRFFSCSANDRILMRRFVLVLVLREDLNRPRCYTELMCRALD